MKPPFQNSSLVRALRRVFRRAKRPQSGASGNAASSPDWLKIGLGVLTIAVLSILMSVHLLPDKISLIPGSISTLDVHANRSVNYVNSEATTRLQQAAALGTRPVYDLLESAVYDADHRVAEDFDRFLRERERLKMAPATNHDALRQAISDLEPQFVGRFNRSQIRSLLTLSPEAFTRLRDFTKEQVARAMDRDLRDFSDVGRAANDVQDAQKDIANAARMELRSAELAGIVKAVVDKALHPNRLLNTSKTQAARYAAVRSVRPVYEHITRGDKLIGVGETVTPSHLDKFTALGLRDPHLDLTTGAAVSILAAAMVLLIVYMIQHNLPALFADRKRLALLSVIVCLSVLGLKVGATMLGLTYGGGQPGYLGMMSVVAAGMLVSVLLDRQLAFLIAALLSVQTGLIMNHEIRFTVMTLMSSLVGIASASPVRSRSNLLATTGALVCANVALVWLMGLLLRDPLAEMLNGTLWAVASAGFAAFLFWFGVLALEKPFGILTHTTLLEMCAADRPLLKELCMAAPGTYAHSIMVGTLAEAGAQAIGADGLLCRVGGYYHDIGKMNNPEFFVENQRRENVHGRLSPSLSALIITGHVRSGVEMAHQHKLPNEIRDIIAQHHGTTLIAYFYHRALADVGNDEAPPGLEARFRYPGPKPQTREAAIVMLADSVEAATRCLDKPTPERLEAEIAKIVHGKIEDQQFDDCRLTFRDVREISSAFLHVLTAMMHGRIRYPSEAPRTASGQPMEVSRADLRPAVPAPLPNLPEEAKATNGVLPEAEARVPVTSHPFNPLVAPASEAVAPTPSEAEPFATFNTFGAVGALEFDSAEVAASDLPNTVPLSPRNGIEKGASPNPLFVEPEILYGRSGTERTNPPDPNPAPASSSPPSPPRRRPAPRRGQHSSDR